MADMSFHEIEHQAWTARASSYDALFAPVATQAIAAILASLEPLQGKRLLDVACGTGHLVATASASGAVSEGIDFSQAMIAAAQANYPASQFKVGNAASLPYEDGSFDAVSCSFGLSHMENPLGPVTEAFRVLKPGGRYGFTLWCGAEDGGELIAILTNALKKYVVVNFELPEKWVQLRFADEQACTAITRQAGFDMPVFQKIPIVLRTAYAQQIVDILDRLSVRAKMIIEHQPPEVQEKILQYVRSEVEARRTNGIISLSWPALLTVVRKPA